MAEFNNHNPQYGEGGGGGEQHIVSDPFELQESLAALAPTKGGLTRRINNFRALLEGQRVYARQELVTAMSNIDDACRTMMAQLQECIERGLRLDHPSHADCLTRQNLVEQYREIYEARLADFNEHDSISHARISENVHTHTDRASALSRPRTSASDARLLRDAYAAKVKNDTNELQRQSEIEINSLRARRNIRRAQAKAAKEEREARRRAEQEEREAQQQAEHEERQARLEEEVAEQELQQRELEIAAEMEARQDALREEHLLMRAKVIAQTGGSERPPSLPGLPVGQRSDVSRSTMSRRSRNAELARSLLNERVHRVAPSEASSRDSRSTINLLLEDRDRVASEDGPTVDKVIHPSPLATLRPLDNRTPPILRPPANTLTAASTVPQESRTPLSQNLNFDALQYPPKDQSHPENDRSQMHLPETRNLNPNANVLTPHMPENAPQVEPRAVLPPLLNLPAEPRVLVPTKVAPTTREAAGGRNAPSLNSNRVSSTQKATSKQGQNSRPATVQIPGAPATALLLPELYEPAPHIPVMSHAVSELPAELDNAHNRRSALHHLALPRGQDSSFPRHRLSSTPALDSGAGVIPDEETIRVRLKNAELEKRVKLEARQLAIERQRVALESQRAAAEAQRTAEVERQLALQKDLARLRSAPVHPKKADIFSNMEPTVPKVPSPQIRHANQTEQTSIMAYAPQPSEHLALPDPARPTDYSRSERPAQTYVPADKVTRFETPSPLSTESVSETSNPHNDYMAAYLLQNLGPKREPFKGNPDNYQRFILDYERAACRLKSRPEMCFQVLRGMLAGKALDSISRYEIEEDPAVALREALATLKRSFGTAEKQCRAQLEALLALPKVKDTESGFLKFEGELDTCYRIMGRCKRTRDLDASYVLKCLFQKLPHYVQNRFDKEVQKTPDRVPTYQLLMKVVKDEHYRKTSEVNYWREETRKTKKEPRKDLDLAPVKINQTRRVTTEGHVA